VKLLVDAMCADFGGIHTYVGHLLPQWGEAFPDDELHVALPAGSSLTTGAATRHELPVRGPQVLGRPLEQTFALPRLARRLGVDAVLATNPTTTLRRPGAPLVVVVHDLRHELRPEQFSPGRRALRWAAYGRSYALADGFVAVSARTLADLHDRHPATRSVPSAVVHHGADHVLDWPAPSRSGPLIAFGHHTNKNPDLVVDAWGVLAARGLTPRLTLLGLGGADRARVASRVAATGVGAQVELAPFLAEDAFRERFASAEAVVFPSEFEGFGLPVLEAMLLGKPVVIGPDAGTMEAADGHAVVTSGWTADAVADAVQRALTLGRPELTAARQYAVGCSWRRAAVQTRALVARVAGPD
jgi:glycosyltransferase involved in cell wall biosynthesis